MRAVMVSLMVLGACGEDVPRGRVQFGFPVAEPELIDQFQTWWAEQGEPEGLPGPGCTQR